MPAGREPRRSNSDIADGTVLTSTTSPAASSSGSASAFSARTSFPPAPRVAKISKTDRSKQTEVDASRPSYSSGEYIVRAQRTIPTALRCWIATPFGTPVEPEVKMTYARLSGRAVSASAGASAGSSSGCSSQPGSRNTVRSPCGSSSPSMPANRRRVTSTLACEVFEHQQHALLRVLGVERHVGASRLEHGEERDDEVRLAIHQHAGQGLGAEPLRPQAARQPVGPAVQLAVGEPPLRGHERHPIGDPRRLGLEELVQAGLGPGRRAGVVEHGEELLALRAGQQREVAPAALRIGDRLLEQPPEMAEQALGRRPLIEIGVVSHLRP